MLVARVATGIVAAPLVLVAVWVGGIPLLVLAASAAAVAGWEAIALLIGAPSPSGGGLLSLDSGWRAIAVVGASTLVLATALGPSGVVGALGLALAFSLTLALLPSAETAATNWAASIAAATYAGLPLALLVVARQWPGLSTIDAAPLGRWSRGQVWVMLALTAVWAIDVAAYAVGRLVGRRRLWPRISPKKTWEGTGAGLLAGIAVCEAWAPALHLGSGFAVVLGLALGCSAVLGDLAESALKRTARIKDSGTILPGHGGLLDRIDSLAFASIVVFLVGMLST